jgi:signal transduction histidine kinase
MVQQIKVLVEEIRKKELDRIGRNLHDQIGNTLASALGYLNMKDFNVSKVKTLINQAIVETRFVSHNLVQNDDLPLTEKIISIVSRFNDFSPIHFQFNDFSGGVFNKLPQLEQQNIYTIIQELLTNIIKHSYATNAYVQLFRRNNILSVNVEDDGRGFDITQQFKGIGLQNIRKRAMLMNLHLVIDSTAKGTGIILEIRYESESNNS